MNSYLLLWVCLLLLLKFVSCMHKFIFIFIDYPTTQWHLFGVCKLLALNNFTLNKLLIWSFVPLFCRNLTSLWKVSCLKVLFSSSEVSFKCMMFLNFCLSVKLFLQPWKFGCLQYLFILFYFFNFTMSHIIFGSARFYLKICCKL